MDDIGFAKFTVRHDKSPARISNVTMNGRANYCPAGSAALSASPIS
jgi:hypothetical protein